MSRCHDVKTLLLNCLYTVISYLLGGRLLLLLLLLLLGLSLVLLDGGGFGFRGLLLLLLLFLLLGNKGTEHLLALHHVVLIDVELTEHIVNLGLGHLVAPGL